VEAAEMRIIAVLLILCSMLGCDSVPPPDVQPSARDTDRRVQVHTDEESVATRATVEDETKQEVARVSLQYLMRIMSNRPMVDPITKVIHVAHDKPSQQWFATGTIECAELGGSRIGEENKYWLRTQIKREFGWRSIVFKDQSGRWRLRFLDVHAGDSAGRPAFSDRQYRRYTDNYTLVGSGLGQVDQRRRLIIDVLERMR